MSADNWAICPKCRMTMAEKVETSYGKVTEEEYLALLEEKSEIKETLREDYEIYTNIDGVFRVSYSCHCSVCGLKHLYEYSKNLLRGESPNE